MDGTLVERLRVKAGVIEMGERIAWGSDSALMREAANALEHRAGEEDRLRDALTEARRWIGDGDLSDGLAREYWTPEYAAAVDLVDVALTPNALAVGPDAAGGRSHTSDGLGGTTTETTK